MGQQQLLLIVLGTIIIGIAITVGLSIFGGNSVLAERDALIQDLNIIAANARTYFVKPRNMGGGSYSFQGYRLPKGFKENGNGFFECVLQGNDLLLTARSRENPSEDIITAVLRSGGDKLDNWVFYGKFEEYGDIEDEGEE